MPKSKTSSRAVKKTKPRTTRKTSTRPKQAAAPVQKPSPPKPVKPSVSRQNYTEEYRDYLERYALAGEGRPRLSPTEFDRCDEELLDLLDPERGPLNDDQVVRLQELEFLLIDSEV